MSLSPNKSVAVSPQTEWNGAEPNGRQGKWGTGGRTSSASDYFNLFSSSVFGGQSKGVTAWFVSDSKQLDILSAAVADVIKVVFHNVQTFPCLNLVYVMAFPKKNKLKHDWEMEQKTLQVGLRRFLKIENKIKSRKMYLIICIDWTVYYYIKLYYYLSNELKVLTILNSIYCYWN